MTTDCKHCNEAENKQNKPGLICQNCICFVHLDCLLRPGTPGDFSGDVFFDFTCSECSKDNKEVFKRNKFQWVNVIYLTLYHLNIQSHGISNRGFFHYKTHVCSFIDRHWDLLFEPKFKQKKNWIGTIAGVLSIYNNVLFQSGSGILTESGWWRLQYGFSPAVAAHILLELSRDKSGMKPKTKHLAMDKHLFLDRVTEMGYRDLILAHADDVSPSPPPAKKHRADSDELPANNTYFEYVDSDQRTETVDDTTQCTTQSSSSAFTPREVYSDESTFKGFDFQTSVVPHSECSSPVSHHQFPNYDSDSRSRSPYHQQTEPPSDTDSKPDLTKLEGKIKKNNDDKVEKLPLKRETLFSKELNSIDMPWLPKRSENKDLVELSEYEEIQLLKQVEGLIPKVGDANKKTSLRRLRAKLALRRLKRHKHLPIFDLDKAVKVLGGYATEDTKSIENVERVLDRFQRSYLLDKVCGTVASTNYGTILLSRVEPTTFQSPHSGAVLKPYIRRDVHSTPLWLQLMEELLVKTNRNNKDYALPARASIDYCYVRPHHIAPVNNLCAQNFWPGIDLTEALQYPEFSCVVTYRRLVVGCAFLVPDVTHSEAYVSFVVTRAGWRRAGVAAFMMYHLLQTCTGKDVTLHCSPTNPAIFLYQKFGFKVEELIQDFYEKYYDMDYKGCRHALFLRLAR